MDLDSIEERLIAALTAHNEPCETSVEASGGDYESATAPEHTIQTSTSVLWSTDECYNRLNKPKHWTPETGGSRGGLESGSRLGPNLDKSATQAMTESSRRNPSKKRKISGDIDSSPEPAKRTRQTDKVERPHSTGTPHASINSMAMATRIFNNPGRRVARQKAVDNKIVILAPRRPGGFLALDKGQSHAKDVSEYDVRLDTIELRKNDPLRGFQATQVWVCNTVADQDIEEWFIRSTDDMKAHFYEFVNHYATPEGKAKCLKFYNMGKEAKIRMETQPAPTLLAEAPTLQADSQAITKSGMFHTLDDQPTTSEAEIENPFDKFTPPRKHQVVKGYTKDDDERWSYIRNNPIIGYLWKVKKTFSEYPPNLEATLKVLRKWLHKGPLERRQDFTCWAKSFETTRRGKAQIKEFIEKETQELPGRNLQSVEKRVVNPGRLGTSMLSNRQIFGPLDATANSVPLGSGMHSNRRALSVLNPAFTTAATMTFGIPRLSRQLGRSWFDDPALIATDTTNNFEDLADFDLEHGTQIFNDHYQAFGEFDTATTISTHTSKVSTRASTTSTQASTISKQASKTSTQASKTSTQASTTSIQASPAFTHTKTGQTTTSQQTDSASVDPAFLTLDTINDLRNYALPEFEAPFLDFNGGFLDGDLGLSGWKTPIYDASELDDFDIGQYNTFPSSDARM